jgi:hypothetical protein
MKLDRARFLMLTTAISGAIAACSTTTTNNTTDGGGGGGGDGGGNEAASPDASGTDGAGGQDGTTDGVSPDGAGEAATCDDSVGAAGACASYADGGTGPDAGDGGSVCLSATVCTNLLADLKPHIAEQVIACVAALTDCGPGDAAVIDCMQTSLRKACPDPTDATACGQIASTCSDAGADAGVSPDECHTLTAGMTDSGRTKFVACMVESACFQTDPRNCIPNPNI